MLHGERTGEMTETGRKLTEEDHSNTDPNINPIALSCYRHKDDDRRAEKMQKPPTYEGRRKARKEGMKD